MERSLVLPVYSLCVGEHQHLLTLPLLVQRKRQGFILDQHAASPAIVMLYHLPHAWLAYRVHAWIPNDLGFLVASELFRSSMLNLVESRIRYREIGHEHRIDFEGQRTLSWTA